MYIMSSFWIDYGTNFIIDGTELLQKDAAWLLPLAHKLITAILHAMGMISMPFSPRWLFSITRSLMHAVCSHIFAGYHSTTNCWTRVCWNQGVVVVREEIILGQLLTCIIRTHWYSWKGRAWEETLEESSHPKIGLTNLMARACLYHGGGDHVNDFRNEKPMDDRKHDGDKSSL